MRCRKQCWNKWMCFKSGKRHKPTDLGEGPPWTPDRIKTMKSMPRHIITKLLKIKTKILQAAREHNLNDWFCHQKLWRPEGSERKELPTQNSVSSKKGLEMTVKWRYSQMKESEENVWPAVLKELPKEAVQTVGTLSEGNLKLRQEEEQKWYMLDKYSRPLFS